MVSWTPTGEGPHHLEATAVDWEDNRATHLLTTTLDTLAPTITIDSTVLTITHHNPAGQLELSGRITDTGGVDLVLFEIPELLEPQEATIAGNHWTAEWPIGFEDLPDGDNFQVRVEAKDNVGHTIVVEKPVTVDLVSPAAIELTLDSQTAMRSLEFLLQPGDTIRAISTTLDLSWSPSSDGGGLEGYTVIWETQITSTLTSQINHYPSTTLHDQLIAYDGSKISLHHGSQDAHANQRWTEFGSVYVDSPWTPDYVTLSDPNGIYHGWMESGCSLIGVDRQISDRGGTHAALEAEQSLYATWSEAALRLAWTGANWSSDGDLFIYLDTQPDGALEAYNPFTDTHHIYLPGVTPAADGSPIAGDMAGDYLVWVRDSDTADLLLWDGAQWVFERQLGDTEYRYDPATRGGLTDLYLPFDWISIVDPGSASLNLVAFASQENSLRLWAVLPASNPHNSDWVTEASALAGDEHTFALIHAYHWDSLNSGICPNGSLAASRAPAPPYPDTDLTLQVSSTPTGVTYQYLADDLFWLWGTLFTGDKPADLSTQLDFLDTAPAPLGEAQTISYTLVVHNRGSQPAESLLVDLSAYYALRLPDGDHLPAEERDHQVINLGDLGPGEDLVHTFTALVDIADTQATYYQNCLLSNPPEVCQAYLEWANLEITLYDQAHAPSGPALEYAWIDHPVDAQAPLFFGMVEPAYVLAVGDNSVLGYAYDDSGISAMRMQVQSPARGTSTLNCPDQTPEDGLWTCLWDTTTTNNGDPAKDGEEFQTRLQAIDAHNLTSEWSAWQPYVVDAQAPILSLDEENSQVSEGAIINESFNIGGQVSDNYGLGAVEVCLNSECSNASLHAGTVTEAWTYTDIPDQPITIDSTTTCGGSEIERTFTVAESFTLGEVSLGFNALHVHRDDLLVELVSPNGTRVTLLTDDFASGTDYQDYDLLLSDAAPASFYEAGNDDATAPYFERTARPVAPLAAFIGEDSAGEWQLTICDTNPGTADGTYQRAQLVLAPRYVAATSGDWSYNAPEPRELDYVPQRLTVTATDAVGNQVKDPIRLNYIVDNVDPKLTVYTTRDQALLSVETLVLAGKVNDGGPVSEVVIYIQTPSGETLTHFAELGAAPENAVYLPLVFSSGTARLHNPAFGDSNYLVDTGITATDVRKYYWQYHLTPFESGTYTLWVTAIDEARNTTTSDGYQVYVPPTKEPRPIFFPMVLEPTVLMPDHEIYKNDFEIGAGQEWSIPSTATTPSGRNFLGEFTNETAELRLTELPDHFWVKVSFDLYVIRAWDGIVTVWPPELMGVPGASPQGLVGPDLWLFKVDGETLFTTSFSNWDVLGFEQSYPEEYGTDSSPSRTGADENNTLGYIHAGKVMDAVYHIDMVFPHSAGNLQVAFLGQGLQVAFDESWGIDNIQVTTHRENPHPPPQP
jgi:subtilisin-like proprotein convertase family protein